MQKTIIADTSCLILLDKISELALLKILFGEIVITSIIASEFGNPLPDWIVIQSPVNMNYQHILQTSLDIGEASAIALAVELKNPLLILDDTKARRIASELKINYTGILGILIEAKLSGKIKLIRPLIEKIKETNFYLSPTIEKKIYDACGE